MGRHRSKVQTQSAILPTIREGQTALTFLHQPVQFLTKKKNRSKGATGVPADRGSFFSGLGSARPVTMAAYSAYKTPLEDVEESGHSGSSKKSSSWGESDALSIADRALIDALDSGDEGEKEGSIKSCRAVGQADLLESSQSHCKENEHSSRTQNFGFRLCAESPLSSKVLLPTNTWLEKGGSAKGIPKLALDAHTLANAAITTSPGTPDCTDEKIEIRQHSASSSNPSDAEEEGIETPFAAGYAQVPKPDIRQELMEQAAIDTWLTPRRKIPDDEHKGPSAHLLPQTPESGAAKLFKTCDNPTYSPLLDFFDPLKRPPIAIKTGASQEGGPSSWTGDSAREMSSFGGGRIGIGRRPASLAIVTQQLLPQESSLLQKFIEDPAASSTGKTLLKSDDSAKLSDGACSLETPEMDTSSADAGVSHWLETSTVEAERPLDLLFDDEDDDETSPTNTKEQPSSACLVSMQELILGDYFDKDEAILVKQKSAVVMPRSPSTANESFDAHSLGGSSLDQLSLKSGGSKGSDYDLIMSSSTPAQLALEIEKRQKSLGKLVQFYNSWVGSLDPSDEQSNKDAQSIATVSSEADRIPPHEETPFQSCLPSPLHSVASTEQPLPQPEPASDPCVEEIDSSFATITLPSGGVYTGTLSIGGKPDGLGQYESQLKAAGEATDLYQGEFSRGLMQGHGVYYFGDSGWYAGQWTRGRQQGFGKQIFANGTMCLGQFGRSGRLNGFGICLYPSGDSYEGEFKEGIPHGRGYHQAGNSSAYAGSFVDGRRCGIGAYQFVNGDVFAGTFEGDHPCGQGVYTTKHQGRLEGEFEAGQTHGLGVRILADGTMAASEWRMGRLLWSRLLMQHQSGRADSVDESVDAAVDASQSARHAAVLAQRAAEAAIDAPEVSEAVKFALEAAKRADEASQKVAKFTTSD